MLLTLFQSISDAVQTSVGSPNRLRTRKEYIYEKPKDKKEELPQFDKVLQNRVNERILTLAI
jgi:hypothetical protein